MTILGVSGSPIRESNTDRAIQTVLEATGLEFEFIKLVDYMVTPCKACLGCLKTNRWVIEDDGIMLAEKVRNIVEATLHTTLKDSTHWSTRTMAKVQGGSHVTVQRIWDAHGLQPHRVETFKLSKDSGSLKS